MQVTGAEGRQPEDEECGEDDDRETYIEMAREILEFDGNDDRETYIEMAREILEFDGNDDRVAAIAKQLNG